MLNEVRIILEYARFSFGLVFPQGASLPYWMGSTFRGSLGQHLSRSVCMGSNCPYCRGSPCLFRDVYMPRPAKRGHAQPPKPVILVPPFFGRMTDLPAGGILSLEVVIFGEYVKSFLQLILGMTAFGQAGIGPERHYGGNRFEVESVKCLESGGYVLQDSKIDSSKFAARDIKDLEPLDGDEAVISFKTPFTGPYPPPTVQDILRLTHHRLILFVNEYGTGERIPAAEEDNNGNAILREAHRHTLKRRSSRSEKEFFHGWTGSISINTSRLTERSRWLLKCASIIGMGPDSSFGAGFVDILKPIESNVKKPPA